MSNSSTTMPREQPAGVAASLGSDLLRTGIQLIAAPLTFVSFWAAVALPFLYIPLLYRGLTGSEGLVFAGLLALNVLTLVVGHGYGQ